VTAVPVVLVALFDSIVVQLNKSKIERLNDAFTKIFGYTL